MEKRFLPLILFPLLGILGFALRIFQLRFGFEPDTGLALQGFFPAALLIFLAVFSMALASFGARRYPPLTLRELPFEETDRFLHTAAAVLTAISAVLLLKSGLGGSLLHMLLGLCAAVTAIFQLPLSRNRSLRAFSMMESTGFYLVCLMILFFSNVSNPVLMDFWPGLLALCMTVLAFYELSSGACGTLKPRLSLFALLSGGTLCIIAAADHLLSTCLFYAAALLQFTYAHHILHAYYEKE